MSISTSKFFKGNKIARARRVNAICSLFTRVTTLYSCCARFQPIRHALFFHVHYYAQSNLRYFLVEDPLESVVQQGPETKNIGFFCIREDKGS